MRNLKIYAIALCFLATAFPGAGYALDFFTIRSVKFVDKPLRQGVAFYQEGPKPDKTKGEVFLPFLEVVVQTKERTRADTLYAKAYYYDKSRKLIERTAEPCPGGHAKQSAGETNVLRYSYTPTGRKAAVAWQRNTPEGVTKGRTEYLYNKAGAVAEIRSDGKTVSTYSYDKLGNLLGKQLADGTRELYRHDALGRITELTVKSALGKILTQVAYTWDNADQLVRRTWDGKSQNYVYDYAGQLTGVKSEGLPEERYAYDPAGNMIEKAIGGDKTAMTYDLANRLLTATGNQEARYAYDSAGRIKEEILGGRKTQYEYGLLGKVSRMKEEDARQVDY